MDIILYKWNAMYCVASIKCYFVGSAKTNANMVTSLTLANKSYASPGNVSLILTIVPFAFQDPSRI